MEPLKLGVIGLSKGNGHPYSWSAIFNGYDKRIMESCGFPSIPRYLEKQKWPDDKIKEAQVTHVWTQDINISRHIAHACYIDCVVDELEEMLGNVDAVLLARDDAENHYRHASPFLKCGIPVYIDKPISLSVSGADEIYYLEKYPGQIFTCSALRYSQEFALNEKQYKSIGAINEVHAIAPKSWDKYSVHVIEPMLSLCGDMGRIAKSHNSISSNGGGALSVLWESGVLTRIHTTGEHVKAPFSLLLMGSKDYCQLTFGDSFSAFRSALLDFVQGVIKKDARVKYQFIKKVVTLIELGRTSR